jgi:integrase
VANAGKVSTKRQVEALEPKDATYPVPVVPSRGEGVRGLYVQVTPAGCKSFVLRFRLHGRQKTLTLGTFPTMSVEKAVSEALGKWNDIRAGKNPSDEKRAERQAATVKELADRFEIEHLGLVEGKKVVDTKVGQGWALEASRLLKNHVVPALGTLRVKDVEPSDIASMLFKLRSTPTQANRVRSVCSKLFAKAELWGLRSIGSNPTKGQDRQDEAKKDRHLSDRELVAVGKALKLLEPSPAGEDRPATLPKPVKLQSLASVRLLLLSGMRKSELIGEKRRNTPALKWEAVDLEAQQIRLEHHKTVRKAGVRIVLLCPAAVDVLMQLERPPLRVLGNPHVIPGRRVGEALQDLQGVWNQVKEAVNLFQEQAKMSKKDRVNVSDVTIHDIRRSLASLAARMGYPELIVAALLGHSAGTVTAGYARLGLEALRNVITEVGGRMAGLLDDKVDLQAEAKETKEKAKARTGAELPA